MTRVLLLLIACAVSPTIAQDEIGSSSHRQRRVDRLPGLQTGFGTAHLPIECQRQRAQLFFDQGMAMLHGFSPQAAKQAFEVVTMLEPNAPAGWIGLALANLDDAERVRIAIEQARQRDRNASPLEREIIHCIIESSRSFDETPRQRRVRLAAQWRDLVWKFPESLPVRALLVQHVVEASRQPLSPADASLVREQLVHLQAAEQHPVHCCAIYLPFAGDGESVLKHARRAVTIAPRNPQVWLRAGKRCAEAARYQESSQMLQTAVKLFHRDMERDDLLPDQVPGYADACDHLVLSLAQAGQFDAAVALARHMTGLPVTHATDWDEAQRDPRSVCVRGGFRLLWLLTQLGRWQELMAFAESAEFLGPHGASARRLAAARAAFMVKRLRHVDEQLPHLEKHRSYCLEQRRRVDTDAALRRRMGGVKRAAQYWDGQLHEVDLALCEVRWYLALHRGDMREAHSLVTQIRRPEGWEPSTSLLMGDRELAMQQLDHQLSGSPSGVVIARCRSLISQLDDATCAQQLQDRWQRMEATSRIAVDHKLLWKPKQAPYWALADRFGQLHSLNDYRGKPLLLIFYLGAGCPHCIEQLQVMAPMKAEFETAGLSVVTVSADSIEGLTSTFQVVGAGDAMPYLVLSGEDKSVYQAYGAWDEFGSQPLHGAYFIDQAGRIRWSERGKEPYLNATFLLDECRRLLPDGNEH